MADEVQHKLSLLSAFRRDVWGNDSIFKHSVPNQPTEEYLDFGEHLTALSYFCNLDGGKLLIFQEYRDAMDRFNDRGGHYKRGACILGQPGIGKSMFILYAVFERLRKKQPVAVTLSLHNLHDSYVIFSENGVAPCNGSDGHLLEAHDGIWAFSDSNEHLKTPPTAFLRTPGVRVFQAASPAESRWKDWIKERKVMRYFMDIPSVQEIGNLAFTLGCDTEKMQSFATKWGCIPRVLLLLCEHPGYEAELQQMTQTSAERAASGIGTAIVAVKEHEVTNPPSASDIFFVRPRKKQDSISRGLSITFIPTTWIADILVNAVLSQDIKFTRFLQSVNHINIDQLDESTDVS